MAAHDRPSVLTVNAAAVGGGAEKVALSLHKAYLDRGWDASLALGLANWDGPGALQIPRDAGRSAWARALLSPAWRLADHNPGRVREAASRGLRFMAEPSRYSRVLRGFEDFDFPETARILDLPQRRPDVLHLHNLHGAYFDVRRLPALTSACPTIITMHDCWLLTGHCAYPLDCEHWRTACGECPYLYTYVPIPRDQSAANCQLKRAALAGSRFGLAAPSNWLLGMAEAAGVIGPNVDARVIPNGVDLTVFRPGDRDAARRALGLPTERRVVLFAGHGLKESHYKGIETLTKALDILSAGEGAEELLFLALGSTSPSRRLGGIELRFVPYSDDPEVVANYYRAADLYVHPALAENHPLAVIEAMACGTPVVASRVGGIPEIVEHGRTGLLFPAGDASALSDAMAAVLEDEARRAAFGNASAESAARRFSLGTQADAYAEWLEALAGRSVRSQATQQHAE